MAREKLKRLLRGRDRGEASFFSEYDYLFHQVLRHYLIEEISR